MFRQHALFQAQTLVHSCPVGEASIFRQPSVAQERIDMPPLAPHSGRKVPGTGIVQNPPVILQWQPQEDDLIRLRSEGMYHSCFLLAVVD